MWEVVGLRGFNESEICHLSWHGWKRAVKKADLTPALLKMTVCVNYNHGSLTSGDKLCRKRKRDYLENQTDDYFIQLSERMADDRCEPVSEASPAELCEGLWLHSSEEA